MRFEGNFKDAHNYVVTAPAIEGPWSDPVYVNSSGFDPSLFHNDDGRKWFMNMLWNHRTASIGGSDCPSGPVDVALLDDPLTPVDPGAASTAMAADGRIGPRPSWVRTSRSRTRGRCATPPCRPGRRDRRTRTAIRQRCVRVRQPTRGHRSRAGRAHLRRETR